MEGFKMLVKEGTSSDMLEQILNISRRYQAYIQVYYLLDFGVGLNGEGNGDYSGNIGTNERKGLNI